jgi:hypothetical protein
MDKESLKSLLEGINARNNKTDIKKYSLEEVFSDL